MNNEDIIPLFIYMMMEEDYRNNYMRVDRRQLRDARNPFEMPDNQFQYMFRLKKDLVINIIETLEPHVNPRRIAGIPLHMKLLITLSFLGRGSYQGCVGFSSWVSVSQPSVSKSITLITRLITEMFMPHCIQFPTTIEATNNVKEGFFEKFGFRGVVGAIDGTHVNIIAPPVTDADHPPHVYIDRHQQYSLNVMLICDSACNILACDARYPGSVHDAAVYRTSDIRRHLRNQYNGDRGDTTSHLIGDSGYPLEPWLFTPFQVVQEGTPEARFNIMLKSARNVIERVNGILKGRFKALLKHRVLHYHPAKAAYIVYAACILHNMAVAANLELEEDEIEIEPEEGAHLRNDDPDANILELGRAVRQDYIRRNNV